jgi:hypothetical protein
LFPKLGYGKWCHSEHWCTGVSIVLVLHSFG